MGYIRHHAIVVTGQHERISEARQAAVDAGCRLVSEVIGPGINATSSFLVAPDGSKEGWRDSDEGDAARERFIEWLRGQYRFAWAEIVLCGEDAEALIERHAWQFDDEDDACSRVQRSEDER